MLDLIIKDLKNDWNIDKILKLDIENNELKIQNIIKKLLIN